MQKRRRKGRTGEETREERRGEEKRGEEMRVEERGGDERRRKERRRQERRREKKGRKEEEKGRGEHLETSIGRGGGGSEVIYLAFHVERIDAASLVDMGAGC